jgi:proline dehydrogenase
MGLSPAGRTRRYVPALRRRLLFRLATSDTYERLVRALPPIATAARRRALRYVAGETLDDALAVARTLHARGLRAAIDFFGEQVRDAAEAERAVDGYLELARRLSEAPPTASDGVAVLKGEPLPLNQLLPRLRALVT